MNPERQQNSVRQRDGTASKLILSMVFISSMLGCQSGFQRIITVTTYPESYDPSYKRVAVVPFSCSAPKAPPGTGNRISGKIEAQLAGTGNLELYSRSRLRQVMDEKDLIHAGIVSGDVATRYGKIGGVDALVCGEVTRYGLTSQQQVHHSDRGSSVFVRHDAYVECVVSLVDTRDGRIVYSTTQSAKADSSGILGNIFWHPRPGEEVLRAAEEQAIAQVLPCISVVRRQVKLRNPPFRLTTGRDRGGWIAASRISASQSKLLAVINLPTEAGGAVFKVAIFRRGGAGAVEEREFTWEHQQGELVLDFEVDSILKTGGAGEYVAELRCENGTAAWCEFEIVGDA